MTDIKTQIEALVAKAGKAEKSEDALRFSQAATNAANALAVLDNIQRSSSSR